jgi:hypothetical protein
MGAAVIPIVIAYALVSAVSVERTWEESCEMTSETPGASDWPIGYCVEATIALRDELDLNVPEAGAEFIWGTFTAGAEPVVPLSHAWIELGAGYILDLTVGQFLKSSPILPLIQPDEPLHRRYTVVERNPRWAEDEDDAAGSDPFDAVGEVR